MLCTNGVKIMRSEWDKSRDRLGAGIHAGDIVEEYLQMVNDVLRTIRKHIVFKRVESMGVKKS